MGVPLNHPVVMDDQFPVLNKYGDLGIPHDLRITTWLLYALIIQCE